MIDHNLIAMVRSVSIVLFGLCDVMAVRDVVAYRREARALRYKDKWNLSSYLILLLGVAALCVEAFAGSFIIDR
jgi:hypothetical protein